MNSTTAAILFALSHLNITPDSGNMVIMGNYDPTYSARFPKARFLSPFAGQIAVWEKAGHQIFHSNDTAHVFLIHVPQQTTECAFAIATALSATKPDGLVMAVADNQAGGKTLSKRMANFGAPVQDLSKQKCRVVWTQSPQNADISVIQNSIKQGGVQQRNDDVYTQPGVFSWEKQDKGTNILLRHLPQNLTGRGADFGCGVGDISRFILQHNPDISHLTCIDHDRRATQCCIQNLSHFAQKTSVICQDIPTQTSLTGLDFIVMNPPFHTGKTENKDLGKSFITKAHNALKPKGKLYMVANAHLPYDDLLQSLFSSVTMIAKEDGFKIFEAVR